METKRSIFAVCYPCVKQQELADKYPTEIVNISLSDFGKVVKYEDILSTIEKIFGTYKLILLPYHPYLVSSVLRKNGYEFFTVVPHINRYKELYNIFSKEGMSPEQIESLTKNWTNDIDALTNKEGVFSVTLNKNQFITDVIDLRVIEFLFNINI